MKRYIIAIIIFITVAIFAPTDIQFIMLLGIWASGYEIYKGPRPSGEGLCSGKEN